MDLMACWLAFYTHSWEVLNKFSYREGSTLMSNPFNINPSPILTRQPLPWNPFLTHPSSRAVERQKNYTCFAG